MGFYSDQLGNEMEVIQPPKRIISLVPSQTELLYDLGLDAEVVGITKFCIHPDQWFRGKTRVGGTKNLNIERIKQLQPDLIIGNKEENVKEQVDTLKNIAPVWVSDVNDLDEALAMIHSIGEITRTSNKANGIVENIHRAFQSLPPVDHPIRTAYLIWKDPYMTVGSDTFISDMMHRAGYKNVFEDLQRYPCITMEDLNNSCDLVMLSSEPYPFKEKHVEELQRSLPSKKIITVDGEMFSWYGSRLMKAPEYFSGLRDDLLNIRH